ncbi:DegT/DnrJ/EryC1/StrS family aminotransferase [Candidatus Woesearchaeota archaeon]|nr:DegT/DnrJ/EryC1/StrS family aminotransferase [Candidatus Woesearchaeota archaeon]
MEKENIKTIPVCTITLRGNERKYVENCLYTGWISSKGKYVELFEKKFADFCNVKFAVSCVNGTAALHLALESLGITQGDEVIIPDFTFVATANAVRYSRAKPILVDSELDTWNIDVDRIEEKITPKTKAIIPVHIYGHPVNMDQIKKIAKKYSLYVIEDAAQAHGAEYKGKKAGSLGDVGCFSFFANKIITTGEGGMLVTDNEKVANRAKSLRNHASDTKLFNVNRYFHEALGYNYRMSNIHAAVGLAQMEYAQDLVDARIENAKKYHSLLKDIPGLTLPLCKSWAKNVYWMYSILVKPEFGITKNELMAALYNQEIGTRSFFYPISRQPAYSKDKYILGNFNTQELKISNLLYEQGLTLPSSSSLTIEEIKRVAETIRSLSLQKS